MNRFLESYLHHLILVGAGILATAAVTGHFVKLSTTTIVIWGVILVTLPVLTTWLRFAVDEPSWVVKSNHIVFRRGKTIVYSGPFDDMPPELREEYLEMRRDCRRQMKGMRRNLGDVFEEFDK